MPPGAARYRDIYADLRARIVGGGVGAGDEPPAHGGPGASLRREPGHGRKGYRHPRNRGTRVGGPPPPVLSSAMVSSGRVGPGAISSNATWLPVHLATAFPQPRGRKCGKHHITPIAGPEKLTDPRLARMLGVEEGTEVMRTFRVTGPETEPPFQINDTWIHPRGSAEVPEVANRAPRPADLDVPA